jgi:hypothetical protein
MKRTVVLLALVLVLGVSGGAVAASKITGKDVKDSSLTGKDVRNRSLTPADFRGSVRGPQGPQGAQGPAGPPGPVALGKVVRVAGPTVIVPAGGIDSASVACPAGHGLVSGGFQTIAADGEAFYSDSFGGAGWSVGLDNFDSLVEGDVTAIAFCAPSGTAVTARRGDRLERIEARAEKLVERQRALHE